MHAIAQLVASQAERGTTSVILVEAVMLGQFMMVGPSSFMGVKVEEDPQGFLDEMEKIFLLMRATKMGSVNFAPYQLKEVAYLWYEEWNRDKGDIKEDGLLEAFSDTFMDWIFPKELREAKIQEFSNLNLGRMSTKEYALKFHHLSRYISDLVIDKRSRMRKFAFGVNKDLILESKNVLLMKDMDMSRLTIHMQ
ncbi:uncharacterized protein LOC107879065 [Capsicum annuum]|uniref:uncharacterized protein LOC107879065 n=1 Tax=Capsicum annuum TaxID=4072 RepID=UPI001FB12922|nr:uncharacterized protein LOC107879065 [Capsicum annuum]